jgi:hypothetical protein
MQIVLVFAAEQTNPTLKMPVYHRQLRTYPLALRQAGNTNATVHHVSDVSEFTA